jgi:hypothetical protein
MTTTTTPIKIDSLKIKELNRLFDHVMREGAIIKVATGEDRPAAGWYSANTGDITLDDSIDFDSVLTIEGLVTHEASHSLWSNWLTRALIRSGAVTMAELGVIKTLEEARIEAHAVNADPRGRLRLRACYSHLLADGFARPENYISVAGAVTCWALAWGRVHSGVVDPEELEEIDRLMRDRFGDFPMDVLDDLLSEFTTLRFGFWSEGVPTLGRRALKIAQEWLDMVRSLQEAEGEGDPDGDVIIIVDGFLGGEAEDASGDGGEGEETEGESSGTGTASGSGDEGDEAEGSGSGDEAGEDEDKGEGRSAGEGEGDDKPVREVSHGDGGSAERYGWAEAFETAVREVSDDPHRKAAVRRMSNRDRKARIWNNKKARSGTNWAERSPEPRHAHMVTRMAKALEKDATPAVVRTRVRSQLPPGRLNGRGAMAASADRAGGRMTAAEPWRSNKRHHVERPPVIIGVATDTSGSMAGYTEMLGDAAYVVANASKRVNARFAAVTFGTKAEPVVAVGETPNMVRVRSANSGHEAFNNAMAALDGPLRLTDSSVIGRKLLIVVSDGELVLAGEKDRAILWLAELQRGGTDVIWVGVSTGDEEGRGWKSHLVRMAEDAGIRNTRWVSALTSAEEFVDAILDNLKGA